MVIFLLAATSACSSTEDYKFSRANYSLDCSAIKQKLASLTREKENLHKQDGFRFRHMLVLPAIYYTIQIQTKEKQLDGDIYQLKNLVISKSCSKRAAESSAPSARKGQRNKAFYNPYMQYYSQGNRAPVQPQQQYYQQPQSQQQPPSYSYGNKQGYTKPQPQYQVQQPSQDSGYNSSYNNGEPQHSNQGGYKYSKENNQASYLDRYGGEKNYGPGGESTDYIAQRYLGKL